MNDITIGSESLCQHCKHGICMTVKSQQHPAQTWMDQRQNPGADIPPPVYFVESFCRHPSIQAKQGGAYRVGIVISCEIFEQRELPVQGES